MAKAKKKKNPKKSKGSNSDNAANSSMDNSSAAAPSPASAASTETRNVSTLLPTSSSSIGAAAAAAAAASGASGLTALVGSDGPSQVDGDNEEGGLKTKLQGNLDVLGHSTAAQSDENKWRERCEQLMEENEQLRFKVEIIQSQGPASRFEQEAWRTTAPRRTFFVESVRNSADSAETRDIFRREVVDGKNTRGAFVAHDFFIEFVKAANYLQDSNQSRTNGNGPIRAQLARYAQYLLEPVFHDDKETENPQSGILAELIRKALYLISGNDDYGILVQHQLEIKYVIECNDQTEIIRPKEKDQSKRTTITFEADVAIWFQEGGRRHFLAFVEYKPIHSTKEARKAQVDMSVVNCMEKKGPSPCLSVDVAGGLGNIAHWKDGKNIDHWSVCACAIVPNPAQAMGPKYVKNTLLEATGVDGILHLALGLLAAKDSFFSRFNKLLGPVVALTDTGHVVKAYDNSTYCRPNIELVREMVDENAILWTSKTCQIVEMAYVESDWHVPVKIYVFVQLLRQLKALHDGDVVHGDIRHANVLRTGQLIDFDFVGNRVYPEGLQCIPDGRRHSSVVKAIKSETIGKLAMEKIHDLYSMSALLARFICVDEKVRPIWDKVTYFLGKGKTNALEDAIRALEPIGDHFVSLLKMHHETDLYGTGGTPARPPRDVSTRSATQADLARELNQLALEEHGNIAVNVSRSH